MANLLELRGVGKRYAGQGKASTVAMHDIDLVFDEDRPRIVAVVGESGSGKTTLAQMVLGLLQPSQGSVTYRGAPVSSLSGQAARTFRREVQAIMQDPFSAFNPFYLVDHALSLPLRRFGLARTRAQVLSQMQDACRKVGLNPSDTLGRYPHQLSGGQRQRLMVARALMLQPRLIVADEPVSMVDASLRATILENVASLRREMGISVLYITHDLATAFHVADTVIVLYKGNLVEAGEVGQVMSDPSHPYTQLLIDSIAWPDLDRRWGQLPLTEGRSAQVGSGCAFVGRCPVALASCATQAPLLHTVQTQQLVACHRATQGARQDAAGVAKLLIDACAAGTPAQVSARGEVA